MLKYTESKTMHRFLAAVFSLLIIFWLIPTNVQAIQDPFSNPNNKFGIHIMTASDDEVVPAAQLVNTSGGDWGYVTIVIENNDRNHDKWQSFFNNLRRRHLIPIVRLATTPENGYWKRPSDQDAEEWASFLDSLIWPVKNRYVVIYNEPNHATEWGNTVSAADYAKVLDTTITALKNKNSDFFVINGGLDASAPDQIPSYADEVEFLTEMNQSVPGIFERLDGWDSHSYPNPGFVGSPDDTGRGTIRTWQWELQQLQSMGLTKQLPIFITETGWKHSVGDSRSSLPSPATVGEYFKEAFATAWSDPRIVAVTPFLLSYQQPAFANFSFKKPTDSSTDSKVLGSSSTDSPYFAHYDLIASLAKQSGTPAQENSVDLTSGELYRTVTTNETYQVNLTFKNTGQEIWNDNHSLSLKTISNDAGLVITTELNNSDQKIEPGQEAIFRVYITAKEAGSYDVALNLFSGDQQFNNPPFTFNTVAKSPVHLIVKANLDWKKDSAGDYLLSAYNSVVHLAKKIVLNEDGNSDKVDDAMLLPDYTYNFTLSRPFYQSKTIQATVHSGDNMLDFGTLKPDIGSALLKPMALWNLLPLSN